MSQTNRSINFERLTLAGLLVALVIVLIQSDWLWRVDRVFYDAHFRFWSQPAPDDIIIIAVDEASLRSFGRWPWPRSRHANLVDILTEENPKAVAFDIIFAEPDRQNPSSDKAFAEAIKRNGRVILPVLMEQTRQYGHPIETMPFPGLVEYAAGLGHVHVELDPDGIARSLYLYEGLGEAIWPHLSIAMLNVAGISHQSLPSEDKTHIPGSPMVWKRDQPVLIPFLGPPNHFKIISYQQVLQKNFKPGIFEDAYVFVGTTAAGLGDAVPTPVSGFSHSMSGVELNANTLDAVRNNIKITQFKKSWQLIVSVLIALLPVFLFQNRTPRTNFYITVALLLGCIVVSTVTLLKLNLWFPPTTALLAITLSYPLWSLQRLEKTMRYLREELNRLQKQETTLRSIDKLTLQEAIDFQSQVIPLTGWTLLDKDKTVIDQKNGSELNPPENIHARNWLYEYKACWIKLSVNNEPCILGLKWDSPTLPDNRQAKILRSIIQHSETENIETNPAKKDIDLRILQVQQAGQRLRELSRFIDDSIANMADGILVTDLRGKVLLANKRAARYLHAGHPAQLTGLPVMNFLGPLTLKQENTWPELFQSIIISDKPAQTEASTHNEKDLLVQLSALRDETNTISGIVLNFSNITQLKASEKKRTELLNFLSHDLRAPLVSMTALLELAKSCKDQNELASILNRMESNTLRTINLAQQFLQLSRADSSEHFVFSEIDMVTITMNAVEHVWGQMKAANIEIEQHIHTHEIWLMGNGELLERALINLLENAIKYSPPKSTITVDLNKTDEEVRCCISDEGQGIPADDLPKIFDRFYRVKDKGTADYQSAGLGLALVDTVAKRHRGRVDVSSEQNKGSTFCFVLPNQQPGKP